MSTETSTAGERRARVLIGGVGYRWMGDASFGLLASDELSRQEWPPGIDIADLGYGALYVIQDLATAELSYDRLILLSGMERGRTPGEVYTYLWTPSSPDAEEIQERIREAGAGVVDLDHLLIIAHYFDALPAEVLVIEVEPLDSTGAETMSATALSLLPQIVQMVRQAALAPLPGDPV